MVESSATTQFVVRVSGAVVTEVRESRSGNKLHVIYRNGSVNNRLEWMDATKLMQKAEITA